MSGTGRSITVKVEDFEDCRKAGKQTQNELYRRFLEEGEEAFELTVRPVSRGSVGETEVGDDE